MNNGTVVNWNCTCNDQIPQKANSTKKKPGGKRMC